MNEIQISKYLIYKISNALQDHNIKLIYTKHINENFNDYIKDILITKFYTNNDIKDLRVNTFKNRTRAKKKWYSSILDDIENFRTTKELKKDYLCGEIKYAQNMLDIYGSDKFKEFYELKTGSLDELINLRLNQLQTWRDSKETNFVDFLYIKDKAKGHLLKAINADIIIYIADIILNEFNGSLDTIFVERANLLIDNPVFTDGRGKLKLSEDVIEIDGQKYNYNDYDVNGNYVVRTLIKEEEVRSNEIYDKLSRFFDDTDSKMNEFMMSKKNIEFLEKRKIYLDEGELVKAVCKSDSSNSYEAIETRLQKWAKTRFSFINSKNTIEVWGIIDYLKIDDMPNGGRRIEVTIGEVIHQQHIANQVIRLYKDKINKFENGISKELIYIMQKERFICYAQNKNYKGIYTYDFFANRIRFRSKKKAINLNIIEECLFEFVKNEVTVEFFERKNDVFEVQFYDIPEYEVDDLLNSKIIENLLTPKQLTIFNDENLNV